MAFEIKRSTARSRFAATLFAATCGLALTVSAHAEDQPPPQCVRNAEAAVNLDLVRAADNDKTRAVAASALIREWRTSLPSVMRELAKNSGPADRWQSDQSSYFLSVTDILRTTLSTNADAISLFRTCDSASIIRPLVWAARGQNQGLRLNGTLILGNIADNTTICIVLHHLRDSSLSPNGRANLLGVTLAVAGYAYSENSREILKTLELIKSKADPDMAQTQKLVADIFARVNASPNKSTPMAQAQLGNNTCATYNYDGPLQ
jgi:hypothetical protein